MRTKETPRAAMFWDSEGDADVLSDAGSTASAATWNSGSVSESLAAALTLDSFESLQSVHAKADPTTTTSSSTTTTTTSSSDITTSVNGREPQLPRIAEVADTTTSHDPGEALAVAGNALTHTSKAAADHDAADAEGLGVLRLHQHMCTTWPVPAGWEKHMCKESGNPYFVHNDTHRVTWTHPSLARELAGVLIERLPPDWDVDVDDDGVFFVNHLVEMATREPPAPLAHTAAAPLDSLYHELTGDNVAAALSRRLTADTTTNYHSNEDGDDDDDDKDDGDGDDKTVVGDVDDLCGFVGDGFDADSVGPLALSVLDEDVDIAGSRAGKRVPPTYASVFSSDGDAAATQHHRPLSITSADSGVCSRASTLDRHASVSQHSLLQQADLSRASLPGSEAEHHQQSCQDSVAYEGDCQAPDEALSETSSVFSMSSWTSFLSGMFRSTDGETVPASTATATATAAVSEMPSNNTTLRAAHNVSHRDNGTSCQGLSKKQPHGQQQGRQPLKRVNRIAVPFEPGATDRVCSTRIHSNNIAAHAV